MKIDLEKLNNKKLIEWVRKFGAEEDGEAVKNLEGLELSEESVALFDDAKVKAFVTDVRIDESKAVVKLNLKQLAEVSNIFGKEEAFLLVRTDKEFPAIATDGMDAVVIAPMLKEGD